MISSFWQVIQAGARQCGARIVLVDVGPSLGAINRSALIATDFVIVPLAADLFSRQGLRNLGPPSGVGGPTGRSGETTGTPIPSNSRRDAWTRSAISFNSTVYV